MITVNASDFRTRIKNFLDYAAREPIAIFKRSGETFVLVERQQYEESQKEILRLQKQLLRSIQKNKRD